MDVHPTKNVSIGIDPYPYMEKEKMFQTTNQWTRKIEDLTRKMDSLTNKIDYLSTKEDSVRKNMLNFLPHILNIDHLTSFVYIKDH